MKIFLKWILFIFDNQQLLTKIQLLSHVHVICVPICSFPVVYLYKISKIRDLFMGKISVSNTYLLHWTLLFQSEKLVEYRNFSRSLYSAMLLLYRRWLPLTKTDNLKQWEMPPLFQMLAFKKIDYRFPASTTELKMIYKSKKNLYMYAYFLYRVDCLYMCIFQ